ncbi:helix-turn-helix domain-containing protein [Micromonospora sp. WMMC273]|uniref:helix-turn-helix domain-containing protein n=1 Tax=Micromonospora sp. WMMC273 TaxID=3015157 RepID=UPI0022B63AC9|nr:helix-turn-helix domain-containing protein [Micromonospora sp. WMMC273]MCZ7478817.1 helix-turn-helix domain-containing protein [Micromonospora sp. WMMC273]MCZ7478945.1 helix-turn-helix domain-containing protein [Micromonospora sp. WMMC273]
MTTPNAAVLWALDQQCPSAADKLVLTLIARKVGPDGTCHPTRATLAREAHLSDRRVSRAITNLCTAGLLDVRRGKGPNTYSPNVRNR